jgi:hypothetical protein
VIGFFQRLEIDLPVGLTGVAWRRLGAYFHGATVKQGGAISKSPL